MVLYVKQYWGKNPMRVHELAKEFDLKSSDLLKELKSLGINISSHMSGLDSDQLSIFKTNRKREKNKEDWADNMQSASESIRKEENRLINEPPSPYPSNKVETQKELPETFWEWIRNLFGYEKGK